MELRQLRYFVRIVEHGSMGRAALELGVVTSALSQQISRLEGELATRLLQRTSSGVVPTDAGLAFWKGAQLVLRHAEDARRAAGGARLSGHVSVGMPPSTGAMLALPFMAAMRERYPDIRLRLVENPSRNLASMLSERRLDLALLFHADGAQRWHSMPLLEERLFVVARQGMSRLPSLRRASLDQLRATPLILPSAACGLRRLLNAACAHGKVELNIIGEIDGLAIRMDAVRAGHGATIQSGATVARFLGEPLAMIEITDGRARRPNLLASPAEEELSPVTLAARVVLHSVARLLVTGGKWMGASLHES